MTDMMRFSCDDETGEILTYHVNDETGELMVENFGTMHERNQCAPTYTNTCKAVGFPKGYITKTKKYQSLKADIMAGSNTISHRLLLIPTLMFFPGLACILIVILEIYLHVLCHKKNKTLKDNTIYYRSPFHIVTAIFCGACRENDAASKVGQLQDQRRHRYDYIRGIAI